MTNAALTLRSPAACVATIPSLVGFTPAESVVAVWIKEGVLMLTQRADLEWAFANAEAFYEPALSNGPDKVILTFWTENELDRERASYFAQWTIDRVEVLDQLQVTGGEFFSLLCDDPGCDQCHQPIDPTYLIGSGLPEAVPSRDVLIVETRPEGEDRCNRRTGVAIEEWRDAEIAFAIELFTEGAIEERSDALRIGGSLFDIRVRDTLLWQMTQLDKAGLALAFDLAAQVARTMHPLDAAPACTVAGIIAWCMGDGARANIALEHAANADSDYSLMQLVTASVGGGLPPFVWKSAMSEVGLEACRYGSKPKPSRVPRASVKRRAVKVSAQTIEEAEMYQAELEAGNA